MFGRKGLIVIIAINAISLAIFPTILQAATLAAFSSMLIWD